jgi:hypothetical protein
MLPPASEHPVGGATEAVVCKTTQSQVTPARDSNT